MTGINGLGGNLHALQLLQRQQQPQPQQQQRDQPAGGQAQDQAAAQPAATPHSEAQYSPYHFTFAGDSSSLATTSPTLNAAPTATEITQDTLTNTSPVAQDVQAATETYEAAQTAAQAADQELEAQLAEVGPSLTEQQKQDYIAAYHKEHTDIYDAETKAATDLETKLSDPAVVEAARTDPAVASQIQSALTDLAEGNHGQAVLDWLAANMQDSSDFGFGASAYEDLVTEALNSASASAATASDPAKALNDVVQSLEQLKSLNGAPKVVLDAADTMEDLQKAIAEGASAVEAFFQIKGFEPDANPKLMSAAYLMTMAQAANGLVQGLDANDPKSLIDFGSQVATLAQGGAEKVAAAAKNGSEFLDNVSQRINSSLGSLAQNAEAVAKIMHGAAGVLGAFAAVVDFADYLNDPNADAWDGLSAVGSLLSAIPVPWIAGIGSILSIVGEIGGAIAGRADRAEEQAKLLETIGLPADVASAIAYDPSAGAALAEAGLSPQEIQQLAGSHPGLFESTDQGAEAFSKAVASMGLNGADAIALADALAAGENGEGVFSVLAMNAKEASPEQIAHMIANGPAGGPFEGGTTYLQQHHPEIVDQAEQKQKAKDDVAAHHSSYGLNGDLISGLVNNDDPAYRAEVIKLVDKNTDALEYLVDEVNGKGETEKAALSDALRDAYNEGVIDYETANQYREELGYPPLPEPAN